MKSTNEEGARSVRGATSKGLVGGDRLPICISVSSSSSGGGGSVLLGNLV